jgi:hypothetical protein
MGLVLKTSVGVTSPGVRIPLGPLVAMRTHLQESRVLGCGFFFRCLATSSGPPWVQLIGCVIDRSGGISNEDQVCLGQVSLIQLLPLHPAHSADVMEGIA